MNLGAGIADMFFSFVLAVIAITATVTAGLIFGLPWLWSLIKPWLHHITG